MLIRIICVFFLALWLIGSIYAQGKRTVMRFYDLDSTQIKESIEIDPTDNSLHGEYILYYQNGKPMKSGQYYKGTAEGKWSYFYENGRKKAEGDLLSSKQTGIWVYFFESGLKKSEGIFIDGKKHGNWSSFFENGGIRNSGKYQNNQKEGVWNHFYENGNVKGQSTYTGEEALHRGFHPGGNLQSTGRLKNELATGEWQYFYETGSIEAEGPMEYGKKNGQWKYYYPDESLASKGQYWAGEKTGKWEYFHPNGTISATGSLKNGQKEGQWKLFYETGETSGQELISKGKGEVVYFYPNGSVMATGTVVDEKKDGLWVFFNEKGEKEGEAFFEAGTGEYTAYHENGKVKMKGGLEDSRRVGIWQLFDAEGNLTGTFLPVYEQDNPSFRMLETMQVQENNEAEISTYLYKKKSNRFFDATINEYRGIMVGTNPAYMFLGQLPIGIEYYFQERLGYELLLNLHRRSFFESEDQVDLSKEFVRGIGAEIRQKFYFNKGKSGMFYFGHGVGFQQKDYKARVFQIDQFQTEPSIIYNREVIGYYGLLAGYRWMKETKDKGLTVDNYVRAGVGIRDVQRNYDQIEDFDLLFRSLKRSTYAFPVSMGILVGWSVPKNYKSKKNAK